MAQSQLAEASLGLASYLRRQIKDTANVTTKNALRKLGDDYIMLWAYLDDEAALDQQVVMDAATRAGVGDPLRTQLVEDIMFLAARSPRQI